MTTKQQESAELKAFVAELWNEGRSLEGIAMETGRQAKSIGKMLERMRRAGVKLAPGIGYQAGSNILSQRAAFAAFSQIRRPAYEDIRQIRTEKRRHAA